MTGSSGFTSTSETVSCNEIGSVVNLVLMVRCILSYVSNLSIVALNDVNNKCLVRCDAHRSDKDRHIYTGKQRLTYKWCYEIDFRQNRFTI